MIMDTVPGFDHDRAMSQLSTLPRQAEWEAFVSKCQKTAAGATAREKWKLMERIFKLGEEYELLPQNANGVEMAEKLNEK
jgi:L-rhamnose mutarotase